MIEPPLSAFRLPRGRHRLPPELVAETQRWRLLAAAGDVLAERGYARTTSAAVADRAGVSRGTFYAQFENVDACLLDAHRVAAGCVLEVAAGACRELRRGSGGAAGSVAEAEAVPAAVEAILEFLGGEPGLAKLLGAEAAAGVGTIAAARDNLAMELARMAPGGLHPILVSGAVALVSQHLDAGDSASFRELGPQLAQLLS
jgi:AcrR family transcriptional regulator